MAIKTITDTEVEKQIAELKESPYVKLAKKEENLRNRRRQYLYCLRNYERKGRMLAAAGITVEILESMYDLDNDFDVPMPKTQQGTDSEEGEDGV